MKKIALLLSLVALTACGGVGIDSELPQAACHEEPPSDECEFMEATWTAVCEENVPSTSIVGYPIDRDPNCDMSCATDGAKFNFCTWNCEDSR